MPNYCPNIAQFAQLLPNSQFVVAACSKTEIINQLIFTN